MKIKNSPSGTLRQRIGYAAFLPHPLPPKINWSLDLVNALSKADHVLGKLSGEGHKLPNPHVLIRPFMEREAVLSSRIEGTQAELGEVLAADAGLLLGHVKDLQEVRNYIAALEYGLERLHTLPVSLRLLREIHTRLMQGVRGQHATPGEFRMTQNWIGAPGASLSMAKYVPPPPEDLMSCLDAFEKFLHSQQLPLLVHLGLCHYQFEALHPFVDGNGRLGRLLIILLLIERKALAAPLLYLSAFFERTREEYYQHLFNVSALGTWEAWLLYFLKGVSLEAADALSRAERINHVLSDWRLKAAELRSGVPARIIECLAVNPFLNIPHVASHLKIAFNTAHRAVQKLEALGIVSPMAYPGRAGATFYCADALFEALKAPVDLTRFAALGVDLPRPE